MRQVARQSARLTRRQQLRTASPRPQSNCAQQTRPFTVGPVRFQDNKPPNGSPEHERYLREQREREHQHRHRQIQPQPQNDEHGKHQDGVEDSIDPQQASSGEARKHGLTRRTYRQRRTSEAPRPPPIPDWFLKYNVSLEAERDSQKQGTTGGSYLKCMDTGKGDMFFTLPYLSQWPHYMSDNLEDLYNDKDRQIYNQIRAERKLKAQSAATAQKEKHPNPAPKNSFFSFKYTPETDGSAQQESKESAGDDGGQAPLSMMASQTHIIQDLEETNGTFEALTEMRLPKHLTVPLHFESLPLHYILLEIESSIRASLSPARSQGFSPSAATRADISLVCPEDHSHKDMDYFVQEIAALIQADTVRIDANDLADLTDEYVGGGDDSPGSFTNLGYDVFDGFAASSPARSHKRTSDSGMDEFDENEADEDEDEMDESNYNTGSGIPGVGAFGSIDDLRKALEGKKHELSKALGGVPIVIGSKSIPMTGFGSSKASSSRSSDRANESETDVQWDDQRLGMLLDNLLDAPSARRVSGFDQNPKYRHTRGFSGSRFDKGGPPGFEKSAPTIEREAHIRRIDMQRRKYWLPAVASELAVRIPGLGPNGPIPSSFVPRSPDDTNIDQSPIGEQVPASPKPRLVVHVRDLRDICDTPLGDAIVERLIRVVQRRRRRGQEVIIIGTTAKALPGSAADLEEEEDSSFRTLVVPPLFRFTPDQFYLWHEVAVEMPMVSGEPVGYHRILEINLRHIQSMLRRYRPDSTGNMMTSDSYGLLGLSGDQVLRKKVLSFSQMQRLVLTTVGLADLHLKAPEITPLHVMMAVEILAVNDRAVHSWQNFQEKLEEIKLKEASKASSDARAGKQNGKDGQEKAAESSKSRVEALKGQCNQHETRLLSGMVDPANIKTAFADVHAPAETIDTLKILTTLSLQRPDAFKYGVLANDRLSGLLLYGPPGTGKTLLAKAVAKESGATVLEVSGAQIYEKYVGEGEKMVKAVFSLAKKLSPCVVFIDEADAIFASRSGNSNRNTHREIINQFLREWDGMDDHSVFMMVASNRPFDLDDAVLRRLPRRLLVDLPTVKDREGILRIHLKGEALAPGIDIPKLAEQTPLYSGSDLKNLCVAAALAAVREENDLLAQHSADGSFKLPEKRTLQERHFEKAIQEISASISEDMSSLSAIRKFDEQYGDRRGRRKKNPYGFGLGGENANKIDESSVRVRQVEQPVVSPESLPPNPPTSTPSSPAP